MIIQTVTNCNRLKMKAADVARKALEEQTGIPVITSQNAMQLNHVVEAMIEASASISEEKQ